MLIYWFVIDKEFWYSLFFGGFYEFFEDDEECKSHG